MAATKKTDNRYHLGRMLTPLLRMALIVLFSALSMATALAITLHALATAQPSL